MKVKFKTADGRSHVGDVIDDWKVDNDHYYKVKAHNGKQYVVMESFIISKEDVNDRK